MRHIAASASVSTMSMLLAAEMAPTKASATTSGWPLLRASSEHVVVGVPVREAHRAAPEQRHHRQVEQQQEQREGPRRDPQSAGRRATR